MSTVKFPGAGAISSQVSGRGSPAEGGCRAPAPVTAALRAMPSAGRSKAAAAAIRSYHQSSARVAARQGSD